MHITAIFADTFDSGLDLCPSCKIKRAEGRVQKRPFTSWIIENKTPAETLLSNLRKLLSPSSPRKDVIILFSKVRSVYRNKHLSENRHEMLESQQWNLDSMWSEPAHRYQQLCQAIASSSSTSSPGCYPAMSVSLQFMGIYLCADRGICTCCWGS